MKRILKLTAFFLLISLTFCCKKDASGPKRNTPPIANAGPDKLIILPVDSVELTGRGTDLDGYIVSYTWRIVSGPPSFALVNPADTNAKVKDLVRGIYEFELTVTDNDALFTTDRTLVFVLDSLNDPLNGPCGGCWDY